jgi:hypothetical protein
MTGKKSGSQLSKFKQAARELQTDDNEKRFNEKLGKIARRKVPTTTQRANPKEKAKR